MMPYPNKNQKGAVLVVSLIMLVLLTLIGLDSIQTTLLEEKMAYHFKDKSVAFQNAESAMVSAESSIDATIPSVASDHVYAYDSDPDVIAAIVVDSATWATGDTKSLAVPGSSTQRYIIQLPANGTNPYIIYTRDTGSSGNSVVILKTYYNR